MAFICKIKNEDLINVHYVSHFVFFTWSLPWKLAKQIIIIMFYRRETKAQRGEMTCPCMMKWDTNLGLCNPPGRI